MPKNYLSLRYNRSIAERNDFWDKLFCDLFWSPFETNPPSNHPQIGQESESEESNPPFDQTFEQTTSSTSVTSSKTPPSPVAILKPQSRISNLPLKHRCRSCRKSFRYRYLLRNHEATHSTERPWPCTGCGKCFKSALALHLHRKRSGHHNWTVRCERCGQTFAKAGHMKRHSGGEACTRIVIRNETIN